MKRHGESQIFMSFAQLGGLCEAADFEAHSGQAVQGVARYGSPEKALKHTEVPLLMASGHGLAAPPVLEGLQPLQEVLLAHQQAVPEALSARYGPPREPTLVQPVVQRPLEPPSPKEVLQQAVSKGAVVKGTVCGAPMCLMWPFEASN